VLLIDLDGVVQHRSATTHARAWRRDRARLLRNWPPNVRSAALARRAAAASLSDQRQPWVASDALQLVHVHGRDAWHRYGTGGFRSNPQRCKTTMLITLVYFRR
jgi:hypothetical protein